MSGFNDLTGAVDQSEALQPIQPEETAFSEEQLDDVSALGIVLQDANEAITYLQSKGLMPTSVDIADDLVRAYVKPRKWADGKDRANMPMFVVLEAIEKIMPTLYLSLFGSGKKQPFLIKPLGKTTPDAARANGNILWWAMRQVGLKEEMRRTLKTCLTYGFVVGWTGWESKNHRIRTYEKDPETGLVKRKWKVVPINLPTYECVNLKNILVDPKCNRQDIQKGATYVIKQLMITANDLQQMREDTDTYKNIPTDEELRLILANKNEPTEDTTASNKRAVWREFQSELESKNTSADPLQQPLEYLEYWTCDRIIGVLQRKIVIRNEENEEGKLPGYSCAFVDVLGSAWGFGVARLLAGEQRLQTGVVGNWIDSLALVLNPVYQLMKGIGPGTQNIQVSPGKVITEAGELKPLVTPDVTAPAMNAVATSEERAAKRVAANGGANMPDQALRTGTGVQALQGDVVQRLQYFLEIFIDMIYIPVLECFLDMLHDHLTPEQVNHILNQEEGKAWQGEILDVYSAQTSLEVIGGTNLMARFAAAQLAPLIMQLVSSAPVQNSLVVQAKKFDYAEFTKETLDLMGWDVENLFVDMTPEDQKRAAAMNPAMAKGAADSQLQDQKHQDDMELANEKGTVEAGVAVVRDAVKRHMDDASQALENMNNGQQ
jgi:hypothetical protein